ncbi:hypothetical protein CYMTET_53747, partial [Cymbomonas tetramitiformis]
MPHRRLFHSPPVLRDPLQESVPSRQKALPLINKARAARAAPSQKIEWILIFAFMLVMMFLNIASSPWSYLVSQDSVIEKAASLLDSQSLKRALAAGGDASFKGACSMTPLHYISATLDRADRWTRDLLTGKLKERVAVRHAEQLSPELHVQLQARRKTYHLGDLILTIDRVAAEVAEDLLQN